MYKVQFSGPHISQIIKWIVLYHYMPNRHVDYNVMGCGPGKKYCGDPIWVGEWLSVKKKKRKEKTFVCFHIHEFESTGSTMNKSFLVSTVRFIVYHFGG